MNSQAVGENNRSGRATKAKTVTFYRSGDVNFAGLRMAITQKNYRTFETLLDELTKKVSLPQGARRVHTPGGVHSVTSVEDLEDGKSYVVTSSKKLKPLNLDSVQKQRVWVPTKKSVPNGTVPKNNQNGPKKPVKTKTTPKEKTPPVRDTLSGKLPPTPKKIMIMKNGDIQTKHMMLLNRRTAQNFEDILQDISEIFKLPVKKLCTPDGSKIESLQAIFNGPEVFVALSGTERFRPLNYLENSPFKASRSRERLRRKSEDNTDQPPTKITKKSKGKWRVWIATNENPAAGTDATVYMVVYGDKGKTDDIILGAGDGYFEAGNEDEFTIQIGDVGEIYKIRIGHDDSTEYAGWRCDEVRMQDVHTGEELIFICDRWMSRDEDDGDICRELAVSRDEDPLSVVKYQVLVTTGNYWGAGLIGKLYITLIGERGDSGPRLLYKSNRVKAFEKGKTDIFSLEAVSLEKLKGILIGHDSDEPERGWFLDKVVVKETDGAKREFLFPCYQWLDVAKGDGAITREISVSAKSHNFENEMWEHEKWKFESGNHVMLIHKASGKAVHVTSSGVIEAGADPSTKMSTAYFVVETLKNNICIFSSSSNSNQILALDGSKASTQAKNGPICEFKVRVQIDSTVALESNKSTGQLLAFSAGGKPTDGRGAIGPNKLFFCYAKGMFRSEGVIILRTSRTQTLMLDNKGDCLATGEKNENAYWKVHKIKEGGIRMFENLSMPESFLQIKNGACNAKGDGDESCHFIVHKVKDKGYVKLQSVTTPESFVGFNPDGSVIPVEDDGKSFVAMSPAVVQVGITKKRPTPTPPTTPRPANRKKRAPLKKRKSADLLEKEVLPSKVPKKDVKTNENDKTSKKSKDTKGKPDPKARVKKVSVVPEKVEKESSNEEENATKHPEPLGEEKSFYEEGDWKVWVKTGTTGTKSPVVLVVYGENKTSEPIRLGKGGDLFTTGAENDFKVNLADFGDIYKIRVGLDTTNKKAAWRLDQVKMKDMNSGQQLTFKFKNRWLAIREDDGSVWREAATIRPGTKPLPIYKYSLQVTTGWEPGSGTDANVYITLNGEKGDTGKRLLHKTEKERFQEGQVNKFELEAVSVQKLKSIVLEHDGKGAGAGWYCKEVVVKETKDSKSEYVFQCNRWLDEGQDDKLIKREFLLTEKRKIKENDWHVYITTGEEEESSLSGPVTLYVYGDKEHKELTLSPSHEKGFISGSLEDFRVNVGDLGKLSKVRIGHNGISQEEAWFLKLLKLVDMNSGTVHEIEANRWLSQKHDDLDVWREFPVAQEGKKPVSAIKYQVQVFTGGEADSNTEANVYIHMFGKNSDSGPRKLLKCKNNKKKFQVGQMDLFEIEAVNLGKLQKVVVGHDGKEKGQGWYLEKIVIKESKNSKSEFHFPCNRWLDSGQDDGKIERELAIGKVPTAPDTVSSEAANTTTDTITVTWEPPSSVTGYKVTLDPPDAPTSEIISSDPKLKKAVFEKLSPGTDYNVNIVAVNGEKESSIVSVKATTKPNKVQNLQGDATEDTLTVTWDKPEGNTNHFKARINPGDAKKSTVKTKDGETTKAKFTGLKPGKKYKVEVRTVVGDVESEIVAVTVTTKEAEVNVPPVSNQALAATADTIKVSWTKPSDDITGYLVIFHPVDGEPKEMNIVDPGQLEAEFGDLKPGSECSVDIIPLVGEKQGEKVTLKGRTASAKDQVCDPKAVSTTSTIHLIWTKPRQQNVDGYLVSYSAPGGASTEIKIDDPDTTEASIEYLVAGREYHCDIRAVYPGDEKSQKVILTQRTKPHLPSNIHFTKIASDSLTLNWEQPTGDLSGYLVEYEPVSMPKVPEEEAKGTGGEGETTKEDGDDGTKKEESDSSKKEEVILDAKNDEVELIGLIPGQLYCITVCSKSESETGEIHTLEQYTKPETVQDLTATVAATSVYVSWKSPLVGGLTGYLVTCSLMDSKDEEPPAFSKELSSDETNVVFEDLTENLSYKVEVFTVSGEEKSDGSSHVVTTVASHDVPQAQDSCILASRNSLRVKWKAPDFDALTGYEINCFERGKLEHKDHYVEQSDDSRTAASKERNGEDVSKEKAAVSGDEEIGGKDSSKGNINEETSEKEEDLLEPSTELVLKKEDNGDSGVSSEADEGKLSSPRKSRLSSINDGGKEVFTTVLDADQTEVLIDGLKTGTDYRVEIVCLCEERKSEVVVLEAKTKTKPPPILSIQHKATEKDIALSWSTPPLDFTGYEAVCYKVLPSKKDEEETTEDGQEKIESEGQDGTTEKMKDPALPGEASIETQTDDGELDLELIEISRKTEVATKTLPPESTAVEFLDLELDTLYWIEIFTLHGDIKNEAGEVAVRTKKVTKPLQVVGLAVEADANALTLTWTKPDCEVTGYMVSIVRPTNPDELVVEDMSSSDEDKPVNVDGDAGSKEGESEEGKGDKEVDEKEPPKLERMCREAETGESVECLVIGEVLESRQLEADQTSAVFGDLDPGTIYALHVASLYGEVTSDWVHLVGKTTAEDSLLPVIDLKSESTRESIKLSWSIPDGIVTSYRIKCSPKDEGKSDTGVDKETTEEESIDSKKDEDSTKDEDGKKDEENKSQENGDDSKDASQIESKSDETENTDKGEEKETDQSEGSKTDEDKTLDQSEGTKDKPGESQTIVNDIGAEMSSHDLVGLTPCTDYVIQVCTLNGEIESEPAETLIKTKGDWTVTLKTHDDTPPSQNATLYLSIFGSSLCEEEIVLSKNSETLLAGDNERQILSKEVDGIFKIRLEAKDVDLESFQGIYLKEVSMKHNIADQELVFKGDVWLRRSMSQLAAGKDGETSKKENTKEKETENTHADEKIDDKNDEENKDAGEGDGEKEAEDEVKKEDEKEAGDASKEDGDKTSEEVNGEEEGKIDVAEGESSERDVDGKDATDLVEDLVVELPLYMSDGNTLPVVKYKLEIYTKDEEMASTSAKVFATLHGSTGDTGRRELWRSDKEVKFVAGQVDTFYIGAVDIGTINKLTLGHDGQTQNDDWKVEKVVASISSDSSSQVHFACEQWFSVERDDKLTERTLQPLDVPVETEGKDPVEEAEVTKETEDGKEEEKNDGEKEAEDENTKEGEEDKKEKVMEKEDDKTEEKEDENKDEEKETEKQEDDEKKDEETKGEDTKNKGEEKETDEAKDDAPKLEEEEKDYVQDGESDA